jgi:tetratricopeptide (TPR) repeat protein
MDVLREAPTDIALDLWSGLRRVLVWLTDERRASPALKSRRPVSVEEGEKWAAVCAAHPSLVPAVSAFALLHEAAEIATPQQISRGCTAVYEWAESRQLLHTAAHFAEAAAYAESDSPDLANVAGQICRRVGLNSRAATWFYRAFDLAVQAKSMRESIRALLGYGVLMYHAGAHEESRRVLLKAARRAERTGKRTQAAVAQHELVAQAAEARPYLEGETHVREALSLYPRSHPRLPHLVHDYGYLLSEKGMYRHALPVLRAALTRIANPSERVVVWANVARAIAGSGGFLEGYPEAMDQVTSLGVVYDEHAPAGFSIAAVAAWLAGDRARAEKLSEIAVRLSEQRNERVPKERAAMVLRALANGDDPPPHAEPPTGHMIQATTNRCISRLKRWRGQGP